ncbi:nucleotide disphospho-sugar-binding domain-containing protein [Nocardia sp. CA-128927]|uniref:nucleotide disphospho-sugar-binding domain-containing protein n=1 Tax=Nocardia sp. CA-128927 TaxID=3239975 RepID=UPI003D99FAB3
MGMLFVPYSAWGHVAPMLAVVAELTARGIAVRVLAGSAYRGAVESVGAVAVVPEVEHEVRVPAECGPAAWAERGRLRYQRRIAWATTEVALIRELRTDPPDVCVVDPHMPWAHRIAIRSGAAVVRLWTTHARRSRGNMPVLVNALRELQPARWRFGQEVHFVGPLNGFAGPLNGFAPEGADTEIAELAGLEGPLLVVAPGTVFERSATYFRGIAEAFAGSEWTVLLATAWLPVPEVGTLPENVLARQWIPQSAVLRRADVFLTHAGMNSVQESLLAGVPMLLAPRSREQRQTAARLRALGVGQSLHCDGGVVQQALRLASDPLVRKGLQLIQARMPESSGKVRAADLLLEIADPVGSTRSWRTP